jgi:hypothetical protein
VAGAEHLPEEIDTEAAAELDEEPVHLAEVGGVAVGVEHGGGGPRVAHVDPHDLVPAARAEAHHLCAVLLLGGRGGGRVPAAAVPPPAAPGGTGDLRDGEAPGSGVGDDDGVGRRRGREEGEARGDGGRHAAHVSPPAGQRGRGGQWSAAAPPPRGARRHAARCEQGLDRRVRWWCETASGERGGEREEGRWVLTSASLFSPSLLLFLIRALLCFWSRLAGSPIYRGERSGWPHPDRNVADRLRRAAAMADAAVGGCLASWELVAMVLRRTS